MQINPQTPITLTLNVETANTILGVLSAQPYDKVAGIIATIQQQAAPQLQPEQQATPAEEPKAVAAAE